MYENIEICVSFYLIVVGWYWWISRMGGGVGSKVWAARTRFIGEYRQDFGFYCGPGQLAADHCSPGSTTLLILLPARNASYRFLVRSVVNKWFCKLFVLPPLRTSDRSYFADLFACLHLVSNEEFQCNTFWPRNYEDINQRFDSFWKHF